MSEIKCKKNKFAKRGFSLLEVVISVFVLSVGILSALTLLTKSINSLIDSRNQIVASQLAQEGIELVVNKRDNNFANDADAFSGIGNTANANTQCCYRVSFNDKDPNGAPQITDGNGNNARLRLFPSTNYYYHGGTGSPQKYFRAISLDYDNLVPPTQLEVKVYVWWTGNNTIPASCNPSQKCVLAQDTLTDWLP